MPIHEYTCRRCDRQFELILQGRQRPRCPECGSRSLERKLSVFAVSASGTSAAKAPVGPCRTCGDPRGPAACSVD